MHLFLQGAQRTRNRLQREPLWRLPGALAPNPCECTLAPSDLDDGLGREAGLARRGGLRGPGQLKHFPFRESLRESKEFKFNQKV